MRTLLLVACLPVVWAQTDSGTISGVISDRSGAVVPGVAVRVIQVEANTQTALVTNDSGFYSAPSLRPGKYEVSVSKERFRPQRSQPFDLRVQDRTEINFQLVIGSTTSEVTVSAI